MITESEARDVFKRAKLPRKRSLTPSKFMHVSWNKAKARWNPTIGLHGRMFILGYFPSHEQEYAARVADQARWFLQDFLPRLPKFNFPEEYEDANLIAPMPAKVREIRCLLISSGISKNAPHFPGIFEPSLKASELPTQSTAYKPLFTADGAARKPLIPVPENEIQCCPNGVNGVECDDCWVAQGGKLPRKV